MSKLLVNERALIVLPTLAQRIGLAEGIVVQQLHFLLQTYDNMTFEHEGVTYFKADLAFWCEQMPWWSESTVRRIFSSLSSLGVIRTLRTSRANGHAINYEVLERVQVDHRERSTSADVSGQVERQDVEREEQQREEERTDGGAAAADPGEQGALPGLEPPAVESEQPEPKRSESKPWQDSATQDELWAEFVAAAQPKRKNLAPGVRTLIAKALKETHDPDDPGAALRTCKLAVHGLVHYRQTKPGEVSLSAIFRTRPGGDALADQIDFWVRQAGTQSVVDANIPSVYRDKVRRRRIEVQQMHQNPESSAIREIGEAAQRWLADTVSEEPVVEDGRVVSWRKIEEAA